MPRGALLHARGVALAVMMQGVLVAMVHPVVQAYWVSDWMGGRPCDSAAQCMRRHDFRTDGLLILQLSLSYHVLFTLRARYSVIAPSVSTILYFGVCYGCGGAWSVIDVVCTVIPVGINIAGKVMLEASQLMLELELCNQHLEVIKQKTLRCNAEYDLTGMGPYLQIRQTNFKKGL